jgi:hypothetical protein
VLRVAGDFDVPALFAVVDEQLAATKMSWTALARQLAWGSQGTYKRMRDGGVASCQIVLPLIQWVGRTPESFTFDADGIEGQLLPDPGGRGWRWYWDMRELAAAVETRRVERDLTVDDVAGELVSAPGEIAHLATTRYGTTMSFAMRCARWLDRTATSFMWEHDGRGLPWANR